MYERTPWKVTFVNLFCNYYGDSIQFYCFIVSRFGQMLWTRRKCLQKKKMYKSCKNSGKYAQCGYFISRGCFSVNSLERCRIHWFLLQYSDCFYNGYCNKTVSGCSTKLIKFLALCKW